MRVKNEGLLKVTDSHVC